MSDMNIDLLRREECQPLTSEQIADIKSQFHPSNTANVNITPYHIYDTDEHVVGELRKEISGVKKRKPVYERTIEGTTASSGASATVTINNMEQIMEVQMQVKYANANWIIVAQRGSELFTKGTVPNELILNSEDNNFFSKPYRCTICYTKSTDSWENVV